VLECAAEAVAPGGAIFVGDVRNFDLLEAFHASVELHRAPASLQLDQLRQRMRSQVAAECELAVAPAFFAALPGRLPKIGRVEIEPKRGRADNELTRFRYDVTLHAAPATGPRVGPPPAEWEGGGWSIPELRRVLYNERPVSLALSNVPNGRVSSDAWAAAAIAASDGAVTAGELRRSAGELAGGIDPEAFWSLGDELEYRVLVSWARCNAEGRYDVTLVRADAGATPPGPDAEKASPARPERAYANQPLARARSRELAPALRAHLRDRLPDYMVPAAFVILNALPLTPNGKVDRRALPAPDGTRTALESFVAPRTEAELRLAAIWTELLGVERVGLNDDFFELGGHSLLAVKLFARIEEAFGHRLPLSTLFQSATIARLAEALELAARAPSGPSKALVALQPRGTRPPLFLAHGAWGSLLRYRDLAARLGADQPVYGFEAPLGPDGAARIQTVEDLAADYIRELRALQPEGPYLLCGYCWAGGLAFEMGCQLQAAGEKVALLAVIDSMCPGHHKAAPMHRRVKSRGRNYWQRIGHNLRRLKAIDPRTIPAFLGARISNFVTELAGGLAFGLSLRLGRAVLPGLRKRHGALIQAGRRHRPKPYPGAVTLIRAHAQTESLADRYWGWDRVALGGVDVRLIDGDHRTIMYEPHVEGLAAELRACLQQAQGTG
ncbi:MAG: hypothetical protein H0T68_06355, partial [Gemmatimonadales bacterium]|nr:hypothetical protein [Gemmatimonadales bacterium]